MNRELTQPKKFLNQRYKRDKKFFKLFHDEGLYHIETSPLIFFENQWIGLFVIENFVMKELIKKSRLLSP